MSAAKTSERARPQRTAPTPPASVATRERQPNGMRAGSFRLDPDHRNTLVRQVEKWADTLSDLNGTRDEWLGIDGEISPEKKAWCEDEATYWYEVARRLRTEQGIK